FVREEGLLLAAEDTCQFYEHRDWSRSADRVNAETTFAHVVGGLLGCGVREAQKRGVPIEDISSPATRNYNLVRVKKDKTGGVPCGEVREHVSLGRAGRGSLLGGTEAVAACPTFGPGAAGEPSAWPHSAAARSAV